MPPESDFEQLFLFLFGQSFHFLDVIVGHLLDVLFNALVIIFRDFGGLLLFLEFLLPELLYVLIDLNILSF